MSNKQHFVDVCALSQKNCDYLIECHLTYATKENFLGRLVDGYNANAAHICLMTRSAAEALCKVQNYLNKINLGLFVFDSYRPLRAVRDFKKWMHQPVQNEYELVRKKIHYPHIEKNQLSELGYIAADVSNHCFGDTVDLSVIDLQTKKLLDMGACFDYFDVISHATATEEQLGSVVIQNRLILSSAMLDAGFLPYEKEFWHYMFHQRELSEPADVEITLEMV